MSRISGLFANRKKATGNEHNTSSPKTTYTGAASKVSNDDDIDDAYGSFENRPSTSCSFGSHGNLGGYYDDDGDDDLGAEEEQHHCRTRDLNKDDGSTRDANAASTTMTPAVTSTGLSRFKRSTPLSTVTPTTPVAAPHLFAPPPRLPAKSTTNANQEESSNFHHMAISSPLAGGVREDPSFMPPPPPRHVDAVTKEAWHQTTPSQVQAATLKECGATLSGNTTCEYASSKITNGCGSVFECHPGESGTNVQQDTESTFDSHAMMKTPAPRHRSMMACSTSIDFSSAPESRSFMQPVTPTHHPRAENKAAATIHHNQWTPAISSHRLSSAVTPDSNIAVVSATSHDLNNVSEGPGFDDMFSSFLQDLQNVKDKHVLTNEQMLEMEVMLDHVIATISGEILQMQEMEDNCDHIDKEHAEIVDKVRRQKDEV